MEKRKWEKLKVKGGGGELETVGHAATCFSNATCHVSSRHVASWPRGYSNCYCRHAANCSIFCNGKSKNNQPAGDQLKGAQSQK
jgi:hypothetical protein